MVAHQDGTSVSDLPKTDARNHSLEIASVHDLTQVLLEVNIALHSVHGSKLLFRMFQNSLNGISMH